MKSLLFYIFIILNTQVVFSQDEYKPTPFITPSPCTDCPEWAKYMSKYEWKEWKQDDKYQRNHQVLMNQIAIQNRTYEESLIAFKFGALSVSVGSLMEVAALSMILMDYDNINENRSYLEPMIFSGFSIMTIGGIILTIPY